MTFDKIIADLAAQGGNLYDFALWTPENGIQFHRFQPCNRCNDSYSVAKAFVMTAIGLLWEDGLLKMEDSLGKIFGDPAWNDVTVHHALTHTIGYGQGHMDIDVETVADYPTDDFLALALSYPRPHAPGAHYQYTDAAFYLLSRVVDHVSGEKMDSLLWRRVLSHMHIQELSWSRCPKEYPIGATGLYIGAADMVKLPMLYLNGGKFEGRQLISSAWVDLAIQNGYELHEMAPGILGKGGMYGQGIAFSPDKKFAAAWHAFEEKGKTSVAHTLSKL